MPRVMIRYKVKPEQAEHNEALVRAVYEELHQREPEGFRYTTLRLADGVSFMHLAVHEDGHNPLPELASFRAFQEGIRERCDEPPVVTEVTEVGSFRF